MTIRSASFIHIEHGASRQNQFLLPFQLKVLANLRTPRADLEF